MDTALLQRGLERVRTAFPKARPGAGVILGSGWGAILKDFRIRGALPYSAIPGLGRTAVQGHAGELAWIDCGGMEAFVFCGRRHWYEGTEWEPVALPVYVLAKFRASVLLLTNAAGAINRKFRSGDLMIIEDHINAMGSNPLIGRHDPIWGARFPDQTEVYDRQLRDTLASAGRKKKIMLRCGVYLAVSGPTYETPAEISDFRSRGADAVGMSTVPEAMLARAAGMRVAGICCITNASRRKGVPGVSHEAVLRTAAAAEAKMRKLTAEVLREIAKQEG